MARSKVAKTKAPKTPRVLSTTKSAVNARRWKARNSRCHELAKAAYHESGGTKGEKLSYAKQAWLVCRKQSAHKATARLASIPTKDTSVTIFGQDIPLKCRQFPTTGAVSCIGGAGSNKMKKESAGYQSALANKKDLPTNLLGLSKAQLGKLRGLLG